MSSRRVNIEKKKQTNNKNRCIRDLGKYLKEGVFKCNDNNLDLNEWQFTWTNLSEAWPTSLFDNMHVILGLIC